MDSHNSQSQSDFGKIVLNYLPILTVISLGIGIISQLVYYYSFHLDILTYLDINEIILSTFTNLLKCISIVLFNQLLINLIGFIRNKTLKITNPKDERLIIALSFKVANIIFVTLFFICSIIFISLYIRYQDSKYAIISNELNSVLVVTYIAYILIIAFPIYFKVIYETIYFKPLNSIFTNVAVSGITILFWTILFSLNNSIDKKLYSTYGSYMEIGDKIIYSNTNYYYIGRTKAFIFFYNAKEDFTDVYQSKDVTVLSLNNKGFIKTTDQLLSFKRKKDSLNRQRFLDSINLIKRLPPKLK